MSRGIPEQCSVCGQPFMGSDARYFPALCPTCQVRKMLDPEEKRLRRLTTELVDRVLEFVKDARARELAMEIHAMMTLLPSPSLSSDGGFGSRTDHGHKVGGLSTEHLDQE